MRILKSLIIIRRLFLKNVFLFSKFHYLHLNESIKKDTFFHQIKECLIYQDEHIIALNKPTNTPMHSISYEKLDFRDSIENPVWPITSIKSDLLKHYKVNFMEEIFSQNKKYSGVIVYALSENIKNIYSNYFKQIRSQKVAPSTYTALCLGKFGKLNGNTQLTLSNKIVNKTKMAVNVNLNRRGRTDHSISCPTFTYNVIEEFDVSDEHLSLVEIKPTSTKWDSIQLFCVNELCPIFYDDVYGGRVKSVLSNRILISPEKTRLNSLELYESLLKTLDFTEFPNFQIPLHLHCSELIVPAIQTNKGIKTMSKHRKINIKADLPHFFKETILKLRNVYTELQHKKTA